MLIIDRGWTGTSQCHFCHEEETVDYLFVQCSFVRQIWFWLEACQEVFFQWFSVDDIVNFALSLPSSSQKTFLIVFSALAWTVWRQRNSICFENKPCPTDKNIILSILTTVVYWTELGVNNDDLNQWLPRDTSIIPMQALPPNDDTQVIVLSDVDSSSEEESV